MTRHTQAPERPGVTDLVARLVDGLGHLLAQHVALARIELAEEARGVGRALGTMALFVPLLVVGYAMLCFGVAFALAPWLSLPGAVLLIAAANLIIGGLGVWRVRRLLKRPVLDETAEAFRESARALGAEAHEVTGVH
jgi:uncharacterized membrane protein YqjE